MNRQPRLPNLARRSIPVAVPTPMQLPLALRWDHPIDRIAASREPEPVAPIVKLRRAA